MRRCALGIQAGQHEGLTEDGRGGEAGVKVNTLALIV